MKCTRQEQKYAYIRMHSMSSRVVVAVKITCSKLQFSRRFGCEIQNAVLINVSLHCQTNLGTDPNSDYC